MTNWKVRILDSLQCLTYGTDEGEREFRIPEAGYRRLARLYEAIIDRLENLGTPERENLKLAAFQEAVGKFVALETFLFHDQQLQLSSSLFRQFSFIQQKILTVKGSHHWNQFRLYLQQEITKPEVETTAFESVLSSIQTFNDRLREHVREFLLSSPALRSLDVARRAKRNEYIKKLGFLTDVMVRTALIKKLPHLFPKPRTIRKLGTMGVYEYENALDTEEDEDASESEDDNQVKSALENVSSSKEPENDEEAESVLELEKAEGEDNDFITFPGKLNSVHSVKALIDTGGGANLLSRKYLLARSIPIPDSDKTVTLKNPDGSASKRFPVIKVKWSFTAMPDRDWPEVEFIVTEDGPAALIGLPFLKETQLIHDQAGKLLFPEFTNVSQMSAKHVDGSIPIYNFDTSGKPAS
ncbi:hypothetical protein BDZ91DRAFT_719760 [Kalaharituber pfeilii]|nr:hypothetical protein BDZ91DRAFT_719760 [Kalaharituber pfeilii]